MFVTVERTVGDTRQHTHPYGRVSKLDYGPHQKKRVSGTEGSLEMSRQHLSESLMSIGCCCGAILDAELPSFDTRSMGVRYLVSPTAVFRRQEIRVSVEAVTLEDERAVIDADMEAHPS